MGVGSSKVFRWLGLGLRLLGGFLLGAGSGFLLAFWIIGIVITDLTVFRGESGQMRYLAILVYGLGFSTLIGSVIGLTVAVLIRRLPWTSRIVACLGYLVAASIPVGYEVDRAQRKQRNEERQRERAQEAVAWRGDFEAKYPRDDSTLPVLLGPLHYPESELADWAAPAKDQTVETIAWDITIDTDDTLEEVVSYYMSVLSTGLRYEAGMATEPWSFTSEPQISAGKRETALIIEGDGPGFRVRFSIRGGRADATPPQQPTALTRPDVAETNRRSHMRMVTGQQRPHRQAILEIFNGLIYPEARLLAAQFPYRRQSFTPNALFLTDASLDDVNTFFQNRLGTPQTLSGHDLFRGDTANGTPTEVEVHPPGSGAPLGGVLIRYRALQ
jgi:hypothetical protein